MATEPTDTTPEPEWGIFSIRQNGMTVAGGSGPYEAIKREAAHYAAVYRQDGEVRQCYTCLTHGKRLHCGGES